MDHMESTREQYAAGRRKMIDAFVAMDAAARGAPPQLPGPTLDAIHADFFDGNVEVKRAFWLAVVMAEIRS